MNIKLSEHERHVLYKLCLEGIKNEKDILKKEIDDANEDVVWGLM